MQTKDEKRAYTKGYQAGRRRVAKDLQVESQRNERQAFLDAAFLAALPDALNGAWQHNGKTASTANERIEVAWAMAKAALATRRRAA